jgi:hypothetical protein
MPITLLNCDLKLAACVVSDRMQGPLNSLYDIKQTAFVQVRNVAFNGEPPILALGIDMHIASTMLHGKRTRA